MHTIDSWFLRAADDPPQHRLWTEVCLRPLGLTPTERALLDTYPDAARPCPAYVRCRLPIDHPGPHLTDAVTALHDETGRWLRWHGRYREMFDAALCLETSPEHEVAPGEPDACLLPDGHTGPHSFTYYPDRRWPFPEEHDPPEPGTVAVG